MFKKTYTFNLKWSKKEFLDFLKNKGYTLEKLHEWIVIESRILNFDQFGPWNPKTARPFYGIWCPKFIFTFLWDKIIKIDTYLSETNMLYISTIGFVGFAVCIVQIAKLDYWMILLLISLISFCEIWILILFWFREKFLINEIKRFLDKKKNSI